MWGPSRRLTEEWASRNQADEVHMLPQQIKELTEILASRKLDFPPSMACIQGSSLSYTRRWPPCSFRDGLQLVAKILEASACRTAAPRVARNVRRFYNAWHELFATRGGRCPWWSSLFHFGKIVQAVEIRVLSRLEVSSVVSRCLACFPILRVHQKGSKYF